MSKKKKPKYKKPDTVNLTEEEILEFMEELKQREEYQKVPESDLRVRAIELLFEEYE